MDDDNCGGLASPTAVDTYLTSHSMDSARAQPPQKVPYAISKTTLALFGFLLFIVCGTTIVSLAMTQSSEAPHLLNGKPLSENRKTPLEDRRQHHEVLALRADPLVEHPKLSAVGSVRNEDLQFVVRTYPEMLSASECSAMIEMARTTGVEPSGVQSMQDSEDRHSFDAKISIMDCVGRFSAENSNGCAALRKIYSYMSVISGYPTSHMEPLNLVRYDVGQYFSAHEDRFPVDSVEMKLLGSQRIMSMLLYLNEVERGGETQFIDINLRITPETGKSLVWKNVPASRHESGIIQSGVKWVAVLFVHDKALPSMFM